MNFITFLEVNGLKQKDLAQFLDVKEPTVSAYVSGKAKPSPDKLKKILDNKDWDTRALVEDEEGIELENRSAQSLLLSIRELQRRIEKLEEEKAAYWELIKKLTDR